MVTCRLALDPALGVVLNIMRQHLRLSGAFQMQPDLAQLTIDGLIEALEVALRIGLCQQITHSIETKSSFSARAWLKQYVPLTDYLGPVR